MKYLSILIFVIILFGCNPIPGKDIPPTEFEKKDIVIDIEKSPAIVGEEDSDKIKETEEKTNENTNTTLSEPNFKVIAEGLNTPWAIDFLPDGRMIFTERAGMVSVVDDGRINLIGTIAVSQKSESGLHGIAVDPDFENNRYIYLYYTHSKANRVSRFIFDEQTLSNEMILLDNIPSARFHDGGRIKFGPDGKLYVTTGDAIQPSNSQNKNSLAGKILRMNNDGSIPIDNPFGNMLWTYGHRNPQGITWSAQGIMYAAEHGQSRNDEVNLILKGENYGWPEIECTDSTTAIMQPIRCFSEYTQAPGGIAYLDGSLYVTGLRGNQLRRLVLGDSGIFVVREEKLFSELGRIREVVSHGVFLYIATSNRDGRGSPASNDDRIIRVKV